jgi:predicted nuclease of predicted toxin-antitoxin system
VSIALLLDENFPHSVGKALAAAGHDVLYVAFVAPGANDRAVLALACEQGRRLLTFDADFGDLVFHHGAVPPPAILYFRVHPVVAEEVLSLALRALGEAPEGSFAVVTREGTRLRPFGDLAAHGRP